MTPAELLVDALGRVRESALAAIDGLTSEELAERPAPGANPIGWLVWHLTRVQDDHVATVAAADQVWIAQEYADRFALPWEAESIGFGQSPDEVGAGIWDAGLLADYLEAVHERSVDYLLTLSADDLDVVVDDSWDPPVTLGARLVSVVNDDTQHAGQAAYARGLLGL